MMFRVKFALRLLILCWIWLDTLLVGRVWILGHPKLKAAASATASSLCTSPLQKTNLPGFRAKRNLAVNHWIREDDLDWTLPTGGAQKADFMNRFSACPIQSGETVILSETRPLPKLEPEANHLTYRLGVLDVRVVQTINAGSRVDIWDENHQIAQNILILALICTPSAPPKDCSAMLDVGPEEFSRLRSSKAESLLSIPR